VTISINQVARGVALQIDNGIFVVQTYSHVKPGKGSAFVRMKIKNVKTGQVLEKTFKSSDKLEDVPLEEIKLQTLYRSGEDVHFMDMVSFEERIVPMGVMGDDIRFLQDNMEVVGLVHDGEVLSIQLPTFIQAEVTHTEPGFKGDTSKAGYKPATIDTGAIIQVPLFMSIGDLIKIDTRTGEYVERVKQ
jgi:elongation factor P